MGYMGILLYYTQAHSIYLRGTIGFGDVVWGKLRDSSVGRVWDFSGRPHFEKKQVGPDGSIALAPGESMAKLFDES